MENGYLRFLILSYPEFHFIAILSCNLQHLLQNTEVHLVELFTVGLYLKMSQYLGTKNSYTAKTCLLLSFIVNALLSTHPVLFLDYVCLVFITVLKGITGPSHNKFNLLQVLTKIISVSTFYRKMYKLTRKVIK